MVCLIFRFLKARVNEFSPAEVLTQLCVLKWWSNVPHVCKLAVKVNFDVVTYLADFCKIYDSIWTTYNIKNCYVAMLVFPHNRYKAVFFLSPFFMALIQNYFKKAKRYDHFLLSSFPNILKYQFKPSILFYDWKQIWLVLSSLNL